MAMTTSGSHSSARDLILILGGAFLLAKATYEINERLEGHEPSGAGAATATFGAVLVQIVALDVVFSLDSVITAVGMVDEVLVMVAAVMIAIGVMLVSAGAISAFVDRHPTVKMLALSFLILIGASLVADGFDQSIPKGYIYGPIAFSILVEALNLRAKARQRRRSSAAGRPVTLRPAYVKSGAGSGPLPALAPENRTSLAGATAATAATGVNSGDRRTR